MIKLYVTLASLLAVVAAGVIRYSETGDLILPDDIYVNATTVVVEDVDNKIESMGEPRDISGDEYITINGTSVSYGTMRESKGYQYLQHGLTNSSEQYVRDNHSAWAVAGNVVLYGVTNIASKVFPAWFDNPADKPPHCFPERGLYYCVHNTKGDWITKQSCLMTVTLNIGIPMPPTNGYSTCFVIYDVDRDSYATFSVGDTSASASSNDCSQYGADTIRAFGCNGERIR